MRSGVLPTPAASAMSGPMLHLMKLAVGVRDPAHLRALQFERSERDPPLQHRTRQMPRLAAEIASGGSMYWVIGGSMLVRQHIVGIEAALRDDGHPCAALLLHPDVVPVAGRPVKAFQGWRYLRPEDAPPDLTAGSPEADLPYGLAQKLRELCLL